MNKVKLSFVILVLVMLFGYTYAGQEEEQEKTNSFRTTRTIYYSIKVTSKTPFGINIVHKTGADFVPFREMTVSDQEKYGYSGASEKQYHIESVKQRAEAELLETISKSGKRVRMRVIQLTKDGALVNGTVYLRERINYVTEYKTITVGLGGSNINNKKNIPVKTTPEIYYETKSLGTIFVAGPLSSDLIDGDVFTEMIYPCGRYQYRNVIGSISTIPRYAINQNVARKLLVEDTQPSLKINE